MKTEILISVANLGKTIETLKNELESEVYNLKREGLIFECDNGFIHKTPLHLIKQFKEKYKRTANLD
jgi:hypothetical protein